MTPPARSPKPKVQPDFVTRLTAGELHDPHAVLGVHDAELRVWRPDARSVSVVDDTGGAIVLDRYDEVGLFTGAAPAGEAHPLLEATFADGATHRFRDPYGFWPTVGDIDIHLLAEGRHRQLWRALGAHVREHQGVPGVAFAVWAPSARAVRVVGDWNHWDGRVHPMRSLGTSGIWELFVPEATAGARYKFEVLTGDGRVLVKADPVAREAEVAPGTGSVVTADAGHDWADADWMEGRESTSWLRERVSVYEVHLGSWRPGLSYRELAAQLPDYVAEMGFTHVELMPVAEHPFGGSWGYQVTSYFAPTSRFGSPDDFRALVDAFHARGIGVIVDWVPAHFPKDDWALASFDGTALYEHADPRQGEHPDWGTLVFNFERNEVRNFLVANALYWLEEFHIDGLRVDAVASMLYLDYSRQPGEWVPNEFGGRENLGAVAFLKELNEEVYARHPGAMMIAEESTAWPAVSRPTYLGGLGFGFKWNMGWMHDTLRYFEKEPVHRRHHHDDLTFGLLYAFTENFVLPLSHDEVVHGKGSMLTKMPGDRWQQLANLRCLYAWMWAHPGKQLVFMGAELAEWQEWSHERGLDWDLLDSEAHRGVQALLREANRVQSEHPALHEIDFDERGFRWIDASDVDANVLSFLRIDDSGCDVVACVANLSPVVRHGYRVGLPTAGRWTELLNTDAAEFGGSGSGNGGGFEADGEAWHGQRASACLTLPPLAVLWLAPVAPVGSAASAGPVDSES